MTIEHVYPLFFGVWLCAMAYVACVLRLAYRVWPLQKAGEAEDAPTLFGRDQNLFRAVFWIVSGRYARMQDPVAARWGGISRTMFFITAPLVLGFMAWMLLTPGL